MKTSPKNELLFEFFKFRVEEIFQIILSPTNLNNLFNQIRKFCLFFSVKLHKNAYNPFRIENEENNNVSLINENVKLKLRA